jgi:hypothetical protein
MPLSAVIMAGGIYLLAPGGIEMGVLPVSVPHPYGECKEGRDRAIWLKHRLQQLLEGPPTDIQGTLIREGLAYEYKYDFCLPRYEIRHTIAYWLTNRQVFTQPPPMPPKRPSFAVRPRGTECQKSSTCVTTNRVVTPAIRPLAIPTPPCISSKKGDGKPSAGCISATTAPRRSG